MRTNLPSEFEAAVLERIASRTSDSALRAQLEGAKILNREHTGVGCYSMLKIAEDAPSAQEVDDASGPMNGPNFESPATKFGGGTLLWLNDGRADCLEICSNGDSFPEDHADLLPFTLNDSA